MTFEFTNLLVGELIPNTYHPVFTCRGDKLAARGKGNRRNRYRFRADLDLTQEFLRANIPEPGRSIVVATGESSSIGAECNRRNPRGLFDSVDQLPRCDIPQDQIIISACEQFRAGTETPERFQIREEVSGQRLSLGRPLAEQPGLID